MNTHILFSYPVVFHRVRCVDSRYAYLVVRDGYVPLRRREGCFSTIWRYEKYVKNYSEFRDCGMSKYTYDANIILRKYDDVSDFFHTRIIEEEYDDVVEESFGELGKLWDKRYDELYGRGKRIKGLRVMWTEDSVKEKVAQI